MPSASLVNWQVSRLPRLNRLAAECATVIARTPTDAELVEDCLHGYVSKVSAYFQGFCRQLYDECANAVVTGLSPAVQAMILPQYEAGCALRRSNATPGTLGLDFGRFLVPFWPAVQLHSATAVADQRELSRLLEWRNAVSHDDFVTLAGALLTLAEVGGWVQACDRLARALDATMFDVLRARLSRDPWTP